MSRLLSAVLSGASSFVVALLVGSAIRDRRTGVQVGLVAATVAAVVSLVAYTVTEAAEGQSETETPGVSTVGSD